MSGKEEIKKTQLYDPIFGVVEKGVYMYGEKSLGFQDAEESIARSLGIVKEIDRNNKFASFLKDPDSFFTKKNTALIAIAKKLKTEMETEYNRLIENGESYEKASEKARAYGKQRKSDFYKQLELDFPTSIERTISAKLGSRKGGIENPKAELN